ncbi:DUF1289 domain-containing protein [Halomonas rhizosphaerae]|uniref:DUF1289 domain-containing protein n=1 Tax=Halomonas rhizosphaerae TaxID=3043296 RepID=A0ABT6V2T1_9GAMM|nr:DUF1289 domain-containing protein [Halomonas rhizosphaerae]MDI5892547.1 DUF1289 domain-containing protein [Halomonas rhizosphaerae]
MSDPPEYRPSPCVQVCRLTPEGTHCEGCGRTLDEIARWTRMDEAERVAVWQRLAREGRTEPV